MTTVQEIYWIPRSRRLAKRLLKRCFGCRRFQAIPFPNTFSKPTTRKITEGDLPFQVIGVDYAGPIRYRKEGIQSLHNRIRMLADPCVVSRVNKDVEYGRVPKKGPKALKRRSQESLFRQR